MHDSSLGQLKWVAAQSRQLLLLRCDRKDLRPAMAYKGTKQQDADQPLAASHNSRAGWQACRLLGGNSSRGMDGNS